MLVVPSFDLNIRSVCTSAPKVHLHEYNYFPAAHFLYFIAQIARYPPLVFVNVTRDKPP